MIIHRTLTESLEQKMVQYPVLFLTRPRQSGKTTLLRSVFSSFYIKANEQITINKTVVYTGK